MTAVEERPVIVPGPARDHRRPPVPLDMRTVVTFTFGLLAVVAVFLLAFMLGLSRLQEHSAQQRLYSGFRQELAEGTAPLGPSTPGRAVALLTVPRLHLKTVVVEGTAAEDLRAGPGHRRDTVLPGQVGTTVVYGRAVTYGGPFRGLSHLRAGDRVEVLTAQGLATYVVDGPRRPGAPTPAPLPAGGGRLVLASLEGGTASRAWAPASTLFVDARLTSSAFPAGSDRRSISSSERLGATDSSGLPLLVLWLQLLLVAGLAIAWASVRWGRWQTWLTGVPVVLALLWAACNAAMPLLPNVL